MFLTCVLCVPLAVLVILAGDTQVMQRLMDLLTVPLANWGERAPHNATAYAEWVGVQQRVALLRAHAHCAAVAIHGGDEVMTMIVSKAHTPYRYAGTNTHRHTHTHTTTHYC